MGAAAAPLMIATTLGSAGLQVAGGIEPARGYQRTIILAIANDSGITGGQ